MSEPAENDSGLEPRVTVLRSQEVLSTASLGLGSELVVGRSPQSHVVLSIGTVSRMHARLFHDDRGVFLEDLGSANGTFVDGQKVEGVVALRSGQLIRLGQSHSDAPTILRIDLSPRVADVGRTRPVDALPDPQSSSPSPGRGSGDEDNTDDDLTLPGLEPLADLPQPKALRTRPVRLPAAPAATRRSATFWIGVGCLALFLLLALWQGRNRDPWRRVTVTPDLLEAGRALEITEMAPGFQFGFDLLVGGVDLEDLEVEGTTGRAIVPHLPDLPPGDHQVSVVGVADGEPVFELTLPYRKAPRIDNLTPTTAHLGQEIVISGGSLGDETDPPTLFVGSYSIEPVVWTASEIRFRVPRVAESPPVELPIRVTVGGLDALAPSPLEILSHRFEAIPVTWSARRVEPGVWEIASPLGPTIYRKVAPSPPGEADETAHPPAVTDTIAALQRLLERSEAEVGQIRVAAVGNEYRYTLHAAGRAPEALFTLTSDEVDEQVHGQETEASLGTRAAWLAHVLTDFAGALAAGRPPAPYPSDSEYREALLGLIDRNLDRGGSGRPGPPDLEALAVAQRQSLERAFVAIPPSLEPLDGRWIGQLDNVFDPGAGQVEVVFDLEQRHRRITGTAVLAFRSSAGTQGFPEATVQGSVTEGVPPGVELRFTVNRPIGTLRLEGEVGGEGILGEFSSTLAPDGAFRASRH